MCHVLLALPLLALPVFWVFPIAVAAPIYSAVIALAGTVYWYAMRAMRQPLQNGVEGMIGEFGLVVECHGREALIRARNELWQATSDVPLCKADRVRVYAVEHMTLQVRKAERDPRYLRQPASRASEESDKEPQ